MAGLCGMNIPINNSLYIALMLQYEDLCRVTPDGNLGTAVTQSATIADEAPTSYSLNHPIPASHQSTPPQKVIVVLLTGLVIGATIGLCLISLLTSLLLIYLKTQSP